MKIPLTFRLLFRPGVDGFFSERMLLKLGDNLTGRVLEVKGNGLALFDFNRMKAWAEVKFPVKEGDVLHVTVVEKGTQLKLKLLSSEQKIPSKASRMLSIAEFPTEKVMTKLKSAIKGIISSEGRMLQKKSIPRHIEVSVARIASHFESLNTGKNVSVLSSQLKSYVENSGVFFEKRIENAIGKLFQFDKEILSKNLHQFPEIKKIINTDLKPNLLILKAFFDGKEMKSLKKATTSLGEIRPLITRLIKDIGAQQNKAIVAKRKHGGLREIVYPNPSKRYHAEQISPKETLGVISKLVPRLHSFFRHSGTNVDERIQHALAKLSDTAEMVSTKRAVAISDTKETTAKETTAKDTLQNDIRPHLKLLKEFFDNKEQTFKAFGTKELESIKLPIDRLLMEMDTQQHKGDTTQQGQKSEPWQTITYSLPLGKEDQIGKLKIYYSKKTKGESKEGFRVSLLLQMERIGDIRTDLSLMDKDLKITFFVNDHKIKTYINDHSDEIKKRLAGHFKSLMLEIVISEKKIKEFETEHMVSESTGALDVIA